MKRIIAMLCVIATIISVASISASAYTISDEAGADKSTAEFFVYGYLGDVDLSGVVNIKDATAIRKHVANIITFKDVNFILGDTDFSESLTVKDATLIQKSIAGLVPEEKIGHLISADSAEVEHVHAYNMEVIPSTCKVEGATKYICDCGETYETPLALASHNYAVVCMDYDITENGEYERRTSVICSEDGCWAGSKGGGVPNEILAPEEGEVLTAASKVLNVSQMSYDSVDTIFNWEATPVKIYMMLQKRGESSIKVSELKEFTMYNFGVDFDWTKAKGLSYDAETDTVSYTVLGGSGGASRFFPVSCVDNGDGTYTVSVSKMLYPEYPAVQNCGTLIMKKLDTGFTPLSLELVEE